jgi:hypothetical protein
MTAQERARYAQQFMARRTSRIVELQSGFNEQFGRTQFAAGTYNGDTQEQANADTDGAPTDTQKVDTIPGLDGTVPREGGDSDPAWKGDLATAITHIQRAIENGGRGLDVNTVAGLNLLASTAQKLVEPPEGVAVPKAVVNPEGSTRDPLHVADNDSASHAGSQGYIQTSELQKMQSEAAQLTQMTSRVVSVTAL